MCIVLQIDNNQSNASKRLLLNILHNFKSCLAKESRSIVLLLLNRNSCKKL